MPIHCGPYRTTPLGSSKEFRIDFVGLTARVRPEFPRGDTYQSIDANERTMINRLRRVLLLSEGGVHMSSK